MLPKTNFPNSSPSSVRAVLNLRRAELTINLNRVKNGLRNSPGRPTLTWRPEKRRALPSAKITIVRGLLLGKKVISVVVGAIIRTHYYKKGGRPLGCPTRRLQPKATTRESSEGLL
jgi:hypothetical protein